MHTEETEYIPNEAGSGDKSDPTISDFTLPVVDDEKDIDLGTLTIEVAEQLIKDRKRELSSQLTKLFHKADQLASDKRKAEAEVRKLSGKLDRTIAQITRLKNGDWTVLKELGNDDKQGDKQ